MFFFLSPPSNNGQVTEDEEGDTGSGLSYGEYLQLDKLLSSQQCESDKHGKEIHDEHLFIIVHQGKISGFFFLNFELPML